MFSSIFEMFERIKQALRGTLPPVVREQQAAAAALAKTIEAKATSKKGKKAVAPAATAAVSAEKAIGITRAKRKK
jgi:hypothetical protein